MTFLKTTFLLLLLCCSFTVLFSQNDNDLYLFTLEKTGKGEYHLHNAKYLSDFNKGGYTNQPSFTPGGDLLVSVRKRNDSQNDIWLLLLNSKKYKILTRTPASEYSPRIHPDEEHITVVRKINGEPIDQQVCNIHLRSGEMTCISEEIKDAGYYSWLGEKGLALYRIEGSGSRLSYYNVSDSKSRRVTTSIGRTLVGDKAGNLIYIHKFTDEY